MSVALQVHHLLYRDVNPWSYSPDEVVVLCEDCHKKRHGITTEPETEQNTSYTQSPFGEYDKGYSFSTDSKTERAYSSMNDAPYNTDSYSIKPEPSRGFRFKYIIYGLLLFLCIMIGRDMLFRQKSITSNNRPSYENKDLSIEGEDEIVPVQSKEKPLDADRPPLTKRDNKPMNNSITETFSDEEMLPVEAEPAVTTNSTKMESAAVKQDDEAKQEAPQRELSTSDIYEKISHTNAIKAAQRAGVSAEGSTSDIYERISHANAIKAAQRAGVSTEGSTSDIYERISHANAIKAAKRAGVSMEGSTSDIDERISPKE